MPTLTRTVSTHLRATITRRWWVRPLQRAAVLLAVLGAPAALEAATRLIGARGYHVQAECRTVVAEGHDG